MTVGNRLSLQEDAPLLITRQRLQVTGLVQGVGFRPFVFRTATRLKLNGFVMNNGTGVLIELEGAPRSIEAFMDCLSDSAPMMACIRSIHREPTTVRHDNAFRILESKTGTANQTSILPDQAICDDCTTDINDTANPRYRYPFTTCTSCGPRYSIMARLPYDRQGTSMQAFAMCSSCRTEYNEPANRRFHAETICCPACGPHLLLASNTGDTIADAADAIKTTAELLAAGKIVAIKGLGGYQLAVDARNDNAVMRLRRGKQREKKPLAIMLSDLETVRSYCEVSDSESGLLCSPERPIVLLKKSLSNPGIAREVAPENPYLGVMLPTTPLHYLLALDAGFPLVMTSANQSDETMIINEEEAFAGLSGIVDAFLVHDRAILRPVDDSVARVSAGRTQVLRLARGYAPFEVILPGIIPDIVATGGHLKSALAVTRRDTIILGQHIGDLETAKARKNWDNCYEQLVNLYGIAPACLVSDLHPDYYSSRRAEHFSQKLNVANIRVQHHLSHLAACMAENKVQSPVLGVTWDGNGMGIGGELWGGEFISVDNTGWTRVAHLREFPLPGGAKAMRDPHRSALGMLYEIYGHEIIRMDGLPPVNRFTPGEMDILLKALVRGINSPYTSSAGRLFDGVSALLGLAGQDCYEGEAACQLEWLADPAANGDAYNFPLLTPDNDKCKVVNWEVAIRRILVDIENGIKPSVISAAFHAGLAAAVVAVARDSGIKTVLLSGGCFQNALLSKWCRSSLEQAGFTVVTHQYIPPGDGCLALGQATWASWLAGEEKV